MPKIHIKQQHTLGREEARANVEKVAEEIKKKLNVNYAWDGDSLQFERTGASGSVDVRDGFIEVNIKLNLALAPMKSKVEKAIRDNLDSALS